MKLKSIGKKEIMSLIKDDLIHIRLVYGLEKLDLNAGNYYLNLNEIIFRLVGIKDEKEDFFEKYIEECRKVHSVDILNHPELLNDMALRLYNELKKEYKAQKHEK
jgi:hypothetical protein